jgi:molybdate transport system ATP-binding protein
LAETIRSVEPKILAAFPQEDHLSVQLRHRLGTLAIDVEFKLRQPWTILFGPSGSGKTTILRAIAGLLRPDFARIVNHRRPVSSTRESFVLIDSESGVCCPAHKRGTALAAQRPALFPHLSVMENMTYGYRGVGSTGEQEYRDELIAKLPTIFQIEHVLDKRPAQLSGGEAQRVSLARAAIAGHKRILLLDEPFAGLDLPLRDLLISNFFAWQEKYRTPVLSVTHDVAEAFQLGAEVIKLAEGRVVEQGPVEVVLAEERKRLLEQLGGSTSQIRDVGHLI